MVERKLYNRFVAVNRLALSNYQDGLEKCKKLYFLSQKENSPLVSMFCLSVIGQCYYYLGEPKSSIIALQKAYRLALKIHNFRSAITILISLGAVYRHLGYHAKSLQYNYRALVLGRNHRYNQNHLYHNIGVIHYFQKDYTKALHYFDKGFIDKKKTFQGIDVYQPSLKISKANALNKIGRIDESKTLLKGLVEYCSNHSHPNIYLAAQRVYANTLLKHKNFKICEDLLENSLSLAFKTCNKLEVSRIRLSLAKLYSKTKRDSKAHDILILLLATKDLASDIKLESISLLHEHFLKQEQYGYAIKYLAIKDKHMEESCYKQDQIKLTAIQLKLEKRELGAEQKEIHQVKLNKAIIKLLRIHLNNGFVFSTLTAIRNLILNNNKYSASDHLATFAQLMRTVLVLSNSEVSDLSQELSTLTFYTKLESLRRGGHLLFQINVHSQVDIQQERIPSLILLPFLEYAVNKLTRATQDPSTIVVFIKKYKSLLFAHIYNLENLPFDNGITSKHLFNDVERKPSLLHNSFGYKIMFKKMSYNNRYTLSLGFYKLGI